MSLSSCESMAHQWVSWFTWKLVNKRVSIQHVNDIAKQKNITVDPAKLGIHHTISLNHSTPCRGTETWTLLARVLRLLATYNIFKETSPDTFSNNRLSCLLDTGNSLELLEKEWVSNNISRLHTILMPGVWSVLRWRTLAFLHSLLSRKSPLFQNMALVLSYTIV